MESIKDFRAVSWSLLGQLCTIVDEKGTSSFHLAVTDYTSTPSQVSSKDSTTLPFVGQRTTRSTRIGRCALVVLLILGIIVTTPSTQPMVFAAYLLSYKTARFDQKQSTCPPRTQEGQIGCIFDQYTIVFQQRSQFPPMGDMIRQWQLKTQVKMGKSVRGIPLQYVGV